MANPINSTYVQNNSGNSSNMQGNNNTQNIIQNINPEYKVLSDNLALVIEKLESQLKAMEETFEIDNLESRIEQIKASKTFINNNKIAESKNVVKVSTINLIISTTTSILSGVAVELFKKYYSV